MAYDAEGWLICKMLQQSDNRVAWSFPFGIHCLTDDSQPFPEQFVHGNGPVCYWGCCLGFLNVLDFAHRQMNARNVIDAHPLSPSSIVARCLWSMTTTTTIIHPPPSATWALLSNWFYLTWLHFNHPTAPPKFSQVNLSSSTCRHEFNVAATSCNFSLIIYTLKFALIIVTEFSGNTPPKTQTVGILPAQQSYVQTITETRQSAKL